jgi:hypothetical protein
MGEDILPFSIITVRRKASSIARQTKDKINIGNNIGNSEYEKGNVEISLKGR